MAVRADFHTSITNTKFEIVITPKMSFGTGHHATTYMMIELMRHIDFSRKSVLDFGTGTGILAILAEKSGAGKIRAIDNDDWSIANAGENLKKNNCSKTVLEKASDTSSAIKVDIILANINKNVILENFEKLVQLLSPNGVILLSGLLKNDKEEVFTEAKRSGLTVKKEVERNNWIALQFQA